MRLRILALLAFIVASAPSHAATYDLRITSMSPPRVSVRASFDTAGDELEMSDTRPGDVPQVDEQGWPALVRNLRVTDGEGRTLSVASRGAKGWRIESAHRGRLRVEYEVDYKLLADLNWPAQREAAFADRSHFIAVGRSLFITPAHATEPFRVRMTAPPGWKVIAPWQRVATRDDLVDNVVAFSRSDADSITASGFRVHVVPIGWWSSAHSEVHRVVQATLPRLVRLIGAHEQADYLVVLLPTREHGGESFRSSFVLTTEEPPSRATVSKWGNTIAHEIFHYWNGWRLRGAEYAASQWFQEGFTEYAANLAMVSSGVTDEAQFRDKLAQHIANSAKLATTLEAPGTHKGPPLYSSGALVAFCWDVMLRQATGGKRNIADVYRTLWRQTGDGREPYDWSRIRAALESITTAVDWQAFARRYIRGTEHVPVNEVLPLVGLRVEAGAVTMDPTASNEARSRWQALIDQGHVANAPTSKVGAKFFP